MVKGGVFVRGLACGKGGNGRCDSLFEFRVLNY